MMKSGATTLWESWDGHGSHDHPALGSPDVWFYTGLAGIRPAAPGYRKILIKPAVVGDLTWVRAEQDTPYGAVRSSWRVADGHFWLDVTIPPNTDATVYVPASRPESVTESNGSAGRSAGVRFVRSEAGFAVYEVGSGHYTFSSARD
jgi:alpha-L-rhamnosidase